MKHNDHSCTYLEVECMYFSKVILCLKVVCAMEKVLVVACLWHKGGTCL